MTWEEWHDKYKSQFIQSGKPPTQIFRHFRQWTSEAWDAAIDAAVEAVDDGYYESKLLALKNSTLTLKEKGLE